MGVTEVRYLLRRWRSYSNAIFRDASPTEAAAPSPGGGAADPGTPAEKAKRAKEPPPVDPERPPA